MIVSILDLCPFLTLQHKACDENVTFALDSGLEYLIVCGKLV